MDVCDVAYVLLIERADTENAAAMAAGAEHPDGTPLRYGEFRDLVDEHLNSDPEGTGGIDEDIEILRAIGLRE